MNTTTILAVLLVALASANAAKPPMLHSSGKGSCASRCLRDSQCCPCYRCLGGDCEPTCCPVGQRCSSSTFPGCCSGLRCISGKCSRPTTTPPTRTTTTRRTTRSTTTTRTTPPCRPYYSLCSFTSQCCRGLYCISGRCKKRCGSYEALCGPDRPPCCSGLQCRIKVGSIGLCLKPCVFPKLGCPIP